MIKIYKYYLYSTIICFLLMSCNLNNSSSGIGGFQLSKNDKFIYLNYFDGESSSIYRVDSSGLNLKLIVPSINNISFYDPEISKDGSKMVLLGGRAYSNKRAIYIANINGTLLHSLTDSEWIITDAFLSEYNNAIIYCKADTDAKFSPIVHSQPHGFDLFSYDLDDLKTTKLTNLNAYILSDVSEYNEDSLLVYLYLHEKGMFFLSKSNKSLNRIIAKNESKEIPNLYYQPIYSKKYNCIVFSNGYGLYIMYKNIVIKIYDIPGTNFINSFCLYNTKSNVLFTIEGDKNFYSINFDGSNLKKINIQFRKK